MKCRHCSSPMKVSAASYAENPWCSGCLHERLALAADENPVLGWRIEGDYLVPIRGNVEA